MSALSIHDVHKRFGSVEVLKGINLEMGSGEFTVLVGPSGCGKSTLLNIVAGLERQSSGSIEIGGRVVDDVAPKDRDIAMVFQSYALYPHMTVAENMSYSLRLRRTAKERIAAAISGAASKLGLDALMERRPRALSGGQRQRVAMGRAIVRAPKAFLFDEPLSNLDARLREQMRGEIKKLHQSLGATSIYVTHDQIEAMTLADRIVAMNSGVVQQVGSPLDLYDRPANLFVAGFIGSPAMNMFDGTYRASGPVIEVEGGHRISLPSALQVADGTRITIGIRPEHIPVGRAGESGIPAKVELVEPTGLGTILHVRPFGATVKAFTLSRDATAVGDTVTIRLPAEWLHLFDAQSGQRVS